MLDQNYKLPSISHQSNGPGSVAMRGISSPQSAGKKEQYIAKNMITHASINKSSLLDGQSEDQRRLSY